VRNIHVLHEEVNISKTCVVVKRSQLRALNELFFAKRVFTKLVCEGTLLAKSGRLPLDSDGVEVAEESVFKVLEGLMRPARNAK